MPDRPELPARLPDAFLTPGSSSFVDFLQVQAPGFLPVNRRLPAAAHPDFTVPHATTVVAATYADGVLIAADRRVTAGNLIANREYEKVLQADDYSAVGIAGSTGIAEEMVALFRMELAHFEKIESSALSLTGKANRLGTLIRGNLELATQGLAVVPVYVGYDDARGRGRIFSYDITGGRSEEQHFAGTGSGSVFALGSLKKLWRADMAERELATAAVQALYDAAEEDTATGGPDATRRLYPRVAVVDAEGFRQLPEPLVSEIAGEVLAGRYERPDGPTAPVL
ncbi:proteasome subunit beta [Streptomyces sp. A7024]|uniref:Proteasome subunit beta n=1 Tax=Streptomyces coryli TaxID=1128680 RepID=A0A6G4U5M4_9ACTN|nr:proteasome subunit beta [Streptomyces coryli]